MATLTLPRMPGLDRIAMSLSGLCAIHCIASAVAFGLLSSVAGLLSAPIIHEAGLVLAMILGLVALGHGAIRHGFMLPTAVGALGLGIMAGALSLPHGTQESAWTILGVLVLAFGHELNRRAFW